MRKQSYSNVNSFASEVYDFLSSSDDLEMANNVMIGLLSRIRKGYYKDAYMVAVKDENRPVLAALQTPPFNLVISKGNKSACSLIIGDILQNETSVPGVVGPQEMSAAFAGKWEKTTGQKVEARTELTFYALKKVLMPEKTQGKFRAANKIDAVWLTDWLVQFSKDAGLGEHEQRRNREATLKRIRDGEIFVWEIDGSPVSIAAYAPMTETSARVGLVYTPDPEREKGYASACVANLSQHILNSGKKWCCLFANNTNPTSNKIYRRLGYEERFTYQEYTFQA